jgi:hypothetical protein
MSAPFGHTTVPASIKNREEYRGSFTGSEMGPPSQSSQSMVASRQSVECPDTVLQQVHPICELTLEYLFANRFGQELLPAASVMNRVAQDLSFSVASDSSGSRPRLLVTQPGSRESPVITSVIELRYSGSSPIEVSA